MSRALLRSVLELRPAVPRPIASPRILPATQIRALQTQTPRQFNPTAQFVDPQPRPSQLPEQSTSSLSSSSQREPPKQKPNPPRVRLPTTPPEITPQKLDPSVKSLLPLLAAQPAHYITIHIHGRPYLVTEGDAVRLPFLMPDVQPGDVLRLNRASTLGSRDFTLKGSPWVDERLFECRAVVTGTEQEPVRVMIKKKRRCRRKKHVFSQHRYTTLTISEVKVVTEVPEDA
ncbi:putative ribosomal protein [Echria macrotheca]|uniref:Large ribosomal subunit protein bL21m n=1 Tax=Echria macrotheca TaxID=438768 RepID=A0AAJ0FCC2_9PEZI|nr:putative ribosomal protein [Echria macrotheca]